MPRDSDAPSPLTYCNPLPLPNYPRGRCCLNKTKNNHGWVQGEKHDFRETADPTVIYHDGKWYLYPSAGMAYVSEDFVTWQHHPLNHEDIGYAPTVVDHRGRFLLTACGAPLYVADDPLGPFEVVAPFVDCHGEPINDWLDPMLFADDDGQLYAYWGIADDGIKGCRLDPDQPQRMVTERKVMYAYNPDHVWERFGEHNQDPARSWVEGPWMLKHGGTYYLTYAAPGTHWRNYAMGTYVSDNPLGPFEYQKRNPILRDTEGFVHGPGHGCIVRGPNDTLWAFYTCLAHNIHWFERRVGVDPAGIDEEGNLFVHGASEVPQLQPGLRDRAEQGNDAGLAPANLANYAHASSFKEARYASCAIDNTMRTWWEPRDDDEQPWLISYFEGRWEVCAIRVYWSELGLDYDRGVTPGPIQYVVDISPTDDGDDWTTVLDRSGSDEDMLLDYRTFPPTVGQRVRLRIVARPRGINTGVINLTVFGKPGTGYVQGRQVL